MNVGISKITKMAKITKLTNCNLEYFVIFVVSLRLFLSSQDRQTIEGMFRFFPLAKITNRTSGGDDRRERKENKTLASL